MLNSTVGSKHCHVTFNHTCQTMLGCCCHSVFCVLYCLSVCPLLNVLSINMGKTQSILLLSFAYMLTPKRALISFLVINHKGNRLNQSKVYYSRIWTCHPPLHINPGQGSNSALVNLSLFNSKLSSFPNMMCVSYGKMINSTCIQILDEYRVYCRRIRITR